MQSVDLCGPWTLRQADHEETFPATVPGCVHTDLLWAGRIPDPFVKDNELACKWVGQEEWIYRRTFDVSEDLLADDRVEVVCEGLDTLATVCINGHQVGQADNMFRTWRWDVGDLLEQGRNEIEVRFEPVGRQIARKQKEHPIGQWGDDGHKVLGGNWIRKMQCNFGWDWGPALVTCGIWRKISLVARSRAQLADVSIHQDHGRLPVVGLDVEIHTEARGDSPVQVKATLRDAKGDEIGEVEASLETDTCSVHLEVRDARLWWPAGMGDQPLYALEVVLLDQAGDELDQWQRRIGLRELHLVRREDEWGESFVFQVNGREFFAKGANWIPADTFVTRLGTQDYRRLLEDARAVNMNMLRVWGGGIYEQDVFYDLCDELGLCVWQDFMFACATYPTFDQQWMTNCKEEFEQNIRRLRHHACLALWCGNNELEMGLVDNQASDRKMSWAQYDELFEKMLPEIVHRLDPQREYWPCSPHNPRGDRKGGNAEDGGDAHIWAVWHGSQPFEYYQRCNHRFISEFGFQSFPEPRTVEGYTPGEHRNVTNYVMEHHQRSHIGNARIMTYMLDWFQMPTSFEKTLWLSQILQGLAIQIGVEFWRRNKPRTMGALYWQLNDCWPVASWASIDYPGRWKALHYMARRFFAPVLLSLVRRDDAQGFDLHAVSDLPADQTACLEWQVVSLEGEVLGQEEQSVDIPADSSAKIATADLKDLAGQVGSRKLLFFARLKIDGQVVSRQAGSLVAPKHLDLPVVDYDLKAEPTQEGLEVTLQSRKPGLYVWLEAEGCDIRCSDNFFDLVPGEQRHLHVTPCEPMSPSDLQERLRVRDLRWTSWMQ